MSARNRGQDARNSGARCQRALQSLILSKAASRVAVIVGRPMKRWRTFCLLCMLVPRAWAADAKASDHWALEPLVAPAVPRTDANPIDAFVRATLAANGLTPSPEADR